LKTHIMLPSHAQVFQVVSFPLISLPKPCIHPSVPLFVLHVPSVSFFLISSPGYLERSIDHEDPVYAISSRPRDLVPLRPNIFPNTLFWNTISPVSPSMPEMRGVCTPIKLRQFLSSSVQRLCYRMGVKNIRSSTLLRYFFFQLHSVYTGLGPTQLLSCGNRRLFHRGKVDGAWSWSLDFI
jgi:hypothetical protein